MLGCCIALFGCQQSQEGDNDQPQARDKGWLTSVPEAEAQAQKENKFVLLDFTGSDWCSWCQKLDAEVFAKDEFSAYASSNLVMVELDFPAKKKLPDDLVKANDALKDKYKVSGFPTLVLLKPDGTRALEQSRLHRRRTCGPDRQIGTGKEEITPLSPRDFPQ